MLNRTRQSLVRQPTNVEQCTARAPGRTRHRVGQVAQRDSGVTKDYRLSAARLQGAEAVARGLRLADYEMATPIDERMTT